MEMDAKGSVILCIVLVLGVKNSQGCLQRNVTCDDIRTDDSGYKFLYDCPEGRQKIPVGREITVIENKTTIACADFGKMKEFTPKVMKMDNQSVVTRGCEDLQVKCVYTYDKKRTEEKCVDYIVTGPRDRPHEYSTLLRVGIPTGIIGILLIIGMLFCYWKKKKGEQHGAPPASLLRYQLSVPRPGEEENGSVSVTLEIPAAHDSPGCDENNTGQDNRLQSVTIDAIDPQSDGETPQPLGLNHNLSNGGIQPSENRNISAPDVNRASDHPAEHRNVKDKPGGVSREMQDGLTHGGCSPEDEDVQQPLLLNERAAIQHSDMTGGAGLVYKHSSDPRQVSRCSTAPGEGVESTTNIKNMKTNKQ